MSSTSTYEPGQVIVVDVPSTGQSSTKRRPALVISSESFHPKLPDVILCPISSQPRYFERPDPGDHPLRGWSKAGLRYPSTARISNILAIEKTIIRRVLGKISRGDLRQVRDGLRAAFSL
jgi:mRNA interferase MazF